jgi:hypothetical protein
VCQAYVDIDKAPEASDMLYEHPTIAIGKHLVLNPMAAFNSDSDIQKLKTEGTTDSSSYEKWCGNFDSSQRRAPIFKNKKIMELAEKLNNHSDVPKPKPFEDEPKPSHLLAIAALLELLKEPVEHPRATGRNQGAIITSIEEKFQVRGRTLRGLSKRQLEQLFSDAKKAMEEAKKP